MKKLFAVLAAAVFLAAPVSVRAAGPVKVVASQAYYADLVRQVGKDKVEVKSVASPKFNVHFFQPKPSDVRNVAQADLVVYTGLDLEAWWGPLVEAAGKSGLFPGQERSVDLSRGVRLLRVPDHPVTRAEGDIHLFGNPHYLLNPENAGIMAGTIAEKLKEIDPVNSDYYEKNRAEFAARLGSKIAEWKSAGAALAGQEVIAYHDEIPYLADFLGMKSEKFLEPKPGIPPTPKHMQYLEQYAAAGGVRIIAVPTYYPRAAADALASKTGAKVAVLAMNVGELPGTEDVITLFDYDVKSLLEASR